MQKCQFLLSDFCMNYVYQHMKNHYLWKLLLAIWDCDRRKWSQLSGINMISVMLDQGLMGNKQWPTVALLICHDYIDKGGHLSTQ